MACGDTPRMECQVSLEQMKDEGKSSKKGKGRGINISFVTSHSFTIPYFSYFYNSGRITTYHSLPESMPVVPAQLSV